MKANIGLTAEETIGLAALLGATLADEYVLYTKTRNYHWNVTGPHFNDLHKFFESQYATIDEKIDEVSEFVRFLGPKVPASLTGFAAAARLMDDTGTPPNAHGMIVNLLTDHESLIRALRADIEMAEEKYHAPDVADFLTGLLEEHEKMAWMLRAMTE